MTLIVPVFERSQYCDIVPVFEHSQYCDNDIIPVLITVNIVTLTLSLSLNTVNCDNDIIPVFENSQYCDIYVVPVLITINIVILTLSLSLNTVNIVILSLSLIVDPYIKVYLLHKQKRMSKWKSTTKKSTLSPIFNDTFEFKILGMDPEDISIEVFVMNHDMLRRNDVIGTVYIGSTVHTQSLGVTHYKEMLASPQHPITHWHKLIPHPHHHIDKTRKRHKSNTM